MKTSTKIWLAIAGILLIVLGIVCLSKPAETLFATAWMIGCATLVAGISKLVFTIRTQAFLPNSGTRMLSALMLIILGFMFLGHNLIVAVSLPLVFSMWVLFEGIVIAVQSFDYKKIGFPSWWLLLLLGIAVIVFGCFSLRNPDVSAATLTLMIGIGLIVIGLAYIFALFGIKRFEKVIGQ